MKDWKDLALDLSVIASITILVALRIAEMSTYMMVVGPLIGVLVANRARSGGNGGGPAGSAPAVSTGSAVALLALGLASMVKRAA